MGLEGLPAVLSTLSLSSLVRQLSAKHSPPLVGSALGTGRWSPATSRYRGTDTGFPAVTARR